LEVGVDGVAVVRAVSFAFVLLISPSLNSSVLNGQDGSAPSAEDTVRELYDLVTFPAGTTPDWNRGRALFVPEAVVILRTTRTATTVFSVEGWVQDFVKFIEDSNVEETGFTERIVRTHATEFGDIAHVWVLYEAEVPGWDRPPQAGVDSFQLAKRDGKWLIASILNEVPTPDRPIPEVLREGG
jgi:hypothetical protein